MKNENILKSKENIIDQHGTIRLIKDNKYKLVHECDKTFLIIDEIGQEVNLSKEYFYNFKED